MRFTLCLHLFRIWADVLWSCKILFWRLVLQQISLQLNCYLKRCISIMNSFRRLPWLRLGQRLCSLSGSNVFDSVSTLVVVNSDSFPKSVTNEDEDRISLFFFLFRWSSDFLRCFYCGGGKDRHVLVIHHPITGMRIVFLIVGARWSFHLFVPFFFISVLWFLLTIPERDCVIAIWQNSVSVGGS